MIALALAAVLSQCVVPTDALPSDAPRAVIILDGQAHVEDASGTPGFVTLPRGLYLNQAGSDKLEKRFNDMQRSGVALSTQNEALKTEVDRVTAAEGSKVTMTTVVIVASGMLLAGAAAGVGIVYAIKR